jgi:hypothetical protein
VGGKEQKKRVRGNVIKEEVRVPNKDEKKQHIHVRNKHK